MNLFNSDFTQSQMNSKLNDSGIDNLIDIPSDVSTEIPVNSNWLQSLTGYNFNYSKYVPTRNTNIKIAIVSTGGIFFYVTYRYNIFGCQTYLTTLKTNALTYSDNLLGRIFNSDNKPVYKTHQIMNETQQIIIPNFKLDIQESNLNPNPNGFQTRRRPEKIEIPAIEKVIYTHPSMLYSLIIGCNYSNTPYELDNCINNTTLVQNMICEFKSDKTKCCKPIIKTDCKENNVTDIMHNIDILYNLCNDNDTVFIYYSGYCDKTNHNLTDITSELDDTIIDKDGDKFEVPMTADTPSKNVDLLTVSCNDDELNTRISINDICDIFVNPKIRLILCIDGFHYDKLQVTDHMKENHLIIGSFVDENMSKTNNTTFTKDVYNYIQEQGSIDNDNKLLANLQIIGNKDLLKIY